VIPMAEVFAGAFLAWLDGRFKLTAGAVDA